MNTIKNDSTNREIQLKAGIAYKITQSVTQAQLKFLSQSHAFLILISNWIT